MSSPPSIISTTADLRAFLATISPANTLYIDVKGDNLGRHGTLSLITVLVYPEKVVRLLDVLVLQDRTFVAADPGRATLQSILEDARIRKCFWDVRRAADALWALQRVGLAGVLDLQLLENATRTGDQTYVHGLGKCIQSDLALGFMAVHRWQRTKQDTKDRMAATRLFAVRPLDDKTTQACVNDVVHLPALHDVYTQRMARGDGDGNGDGDDGDGLAKVMAASAARVADARLPGYDPQASTMTRGPWGAGPAKKTLTMEFLDRLGMEVIAAEMLPDDDMGFDDYKYDDVEYDDYGPICSADAAWDDTFDSCWDRGS